MRRPSPNKLVLGPNDVFDNNGALTGATIVVGAEVANVRNIAVTLRDAAGAAVKSRRHVMIAAFADANGDAFAAVGGSTGLAIAADGALLPVVAKKLFHAISEPNGSITLTYTDTGTEVVYLAVLLGGGRMVISAPLTNT